MRAVILRSIAVVGVGAVVLAGVLYLASTVDARPPEVLGISLTQSLPDQATVALSTSSIEVAFSEPVNETDASRAFRIEPDVDGGVSWSGSTLIFTPSAPLELETAYTVSVVGTVRDHAGNEMSELPPPFEFETAGRPAVVETVPADGVEGVPVDGVISIAFSTLMDTASVEVELDIEPPVAHDLRWAGERLEIVPAQPLRAREEYVVTIGADAADVAGVPIGDEVTFAFTTVAPGLRAQTLVPADGVGGIAPTTPIAIIFDRPIDPETISDEVLAISPPVAGTLELTGLPDEPADPDGAGHLLRFTPSGPLPPNTTFQLQLAAGIASTAGGGLAEPLEWSFTTGAPLATLSNRITFITERGGIANVWAMNPDGTGQHQVTTELTPVLDYAVAPDGSSLVVADGRRLVFVRPAGSERRVLTGDDAWEFDPAYSPNGQRIAFGRVDAATGAGLGLWAWEVGGGDAGRIELPGDDEAAPSPSASPQEVGSVLRAPRYSPDGEALAFVDTSGSVGILELDERRLRRVEFAASAPPSWLPGGDALLLVGQPEGTGDEVELPVVPMEPGPTDAVYRLLRSGTEVEETALVEGFEPLATGADGSVAYVDPRGRLDVARDVDALRPPPIVTGDPVSAAAFAPGEELLVMVVGDRGAPGRLERLNLASGRRTDLGAEGSRPRWLP